MGRTPCCSAEGVKKGAWTSDEDKKLIAYIEKHGEGGWRTLPQKAGLKRCGKSCRLRWSNYLRPDIKRGEFSPEEDQKIIQLHTTLGNRWSAIAKQLEKRTDNEIKNYWNTYLKRHLSKTTGPKCDLPNCTKSSSSNNDQPNSTNPTQNNNVTNHLSQDDTGNMVSRHTDSDPPRDKFANVIPRSASAKLLNRLASRLPSSHRLDILKDGPLIQSPSTQFNSKDVIAISDASSSDSDSRSGSSPARSLLNKMARGINRSMVNLETVKSILSKSSIVGTTDSSTSIGDDLFQNTSAIQPTTSMSLEASQNLTSDMLVQDVPSHFEQNELNGNGSIELFPEDLDLDFLQDWMMMDDDDNGTDVIGGGSYEDGIINTCINGDSHSFESTMEPSFFVDSFEPESIVPCELSDFMNLY